jgi:hypothetical protein
MLTLLLAAPFAVSAAPAFKCTAADGSVAFQDRPCERGARQQRLQLPEYAPPALTADGAAAEDAPAPAPADVTSSPPVPREPPPSFFLCTRYDGSRYSSDSGVGDRYAVPYGMLGGSGRSLAQNYGGRDGIGVSAPGLREIPTLPAAEAPLASAYVEVEDECHRASPQEACSYLRAELDGVRDKLKRAFSDTQAGLQRQERQLRERLRGC